MRISSTRQLELDYDVGSPSDGNVRSAPSSRQMGIDGASGTSPAPFPTFSATAEVYAVTSRMAGRLNAASISEDERQSLLRERQALLDKKFAGQMTRQESNRLEYVRWSLDRIEDARHGWVLDALEGSVEGYERFLSDLHSLREQLEAARVSHK
jgi:hypothetical protein